MLGPAWAQNSGKKTSRGAIIWHAADGPKPDPSFLTPREAQAELRRVLEHEATLRPSTETSTGSALSFAEAAEAWLLNGKRKRNVKRSTLIDYRQVLDAYLLPAPDDSDLHETVYGRAPFATTSLQNLSAAQIRAWYDRLPYGRTAEKLLITVRAILRYARSQGWMNEDPTSAIEANPVRYSGDYDFYSREEIDAVIASAANEQDGAIYLTAAMTGLRRGEVVALRWRDIDFGGQAVRVRSNLSFGQLVTPKSGKVRSVPMVPDVSRTLTRLRNRALFTSDEDPVFVRPAGGHLDAVVLRARYAAAVRRAGLRHLPFHSLRHYFGSMAVNRASLVQVQSWMGHSHIQTTARYLRAKSQADDAEVLARAFASAR